MPGGESRNIHGPVGRCWNDGRALLLHLALDDIPEKLQALTSVSLCGCCARLVNPLDKFLSREDDEVVNLVAQFAR
jgi:hypothetical protein